MDIGLVGGVTEGQEVARLVTGEGRFFDTDGSGIAFFADHEAVELLIGDIGVPCVDDEAGKEIGFHRPVEIFMDANGTRQEVMEGFAGVAARDGVILGDLTPEVAGEVGGIVKGNQGNGENGRFVKESAPVFINGGDSGVEAMIFGCPEGDLFKEDTDREKVIGCLATETVIDKAKGGGDFIDSAFRDVHLFRDVIGNGGIGKGAFFLNIGGSVEDFEVIF